MNENTSEENQHEQLVTQVVEWILAGKSKSDVTNIILENDTAGQLTHQDVQDLIQRAMRKLEGETMQDPKTVIASHIKSYEKIHSYVKKIGHA